MAIAVIQNLPYDKDVDIGTFTGDFTIDFDSSTEKKLIAIAGDGAYILTAKGTFDYSTDETLAASKVKAVTLEADLGGGPLPYLEVTDFKAKLGFFFPDIADGVMTPSSADDFNAILFADDDEIIGATTREAGWLCCDGAVATSTQETIMDPAFYMVLVERVGSYGVADLPFECGTQDNGALIPRDILGDGDPTPVNGDNQ